MKNEISFVKRVKLKIRRFIFLVRFYLIDRKVPFHIAILLEKDILSLTFEESEVICEYVNSL